ncbi:hypothetical protein H0H87_012120 [Tephrocybe sp. NHM501043]|nr:hypothetical protein H0H87_012120 [Tephrocybe sp. NHM501043]
MSRVSNSEKSLDSSPEKEESADKTPVVVVGRTQRSRLLRVPFTSTKEPPPPKESIDDADLIPEATANFFNLVTFEWVTPLLGLGYARPLEAPDLYKLQDSRSAAYIAEKINTSFDRRHREAQEYNARLETGEISPGLWRKTFWMLSGKRDEKEKKWREVDGKKRASLIWAMNDSVKWWFWSGGVLKVIGDTAQVTSPLLVKSLINFATASYVGHKAGTNVPPIGVGIGYAFGLIALQIIASLCTHHFFYRATSTGVLLRGGLITAIYTRSLKLTSRARSTLTNGKLVNHISTDVSRIDFCAGFFHMAWTAPIQMIICLILLTLNLGPSALAGFGFFVLATPVQTMVMKRLFKLRMKSMLWTDKRAKLLQELLGGMKVIKYFAWETSFLARIFDYRKKEMGYIRSLLLIRSANNAVAMSMPVLASVIAAIADAANAASRLYGVFEAELLTETLVVNPNIDVAIEVTDACFTWDSPPPQAETVGKQKRPHGAAAKGLSKQEEAKKEKAAQDKTKSDGGNVFKMKDLNMRIPRGQLVAIVGAVGSGKTSLLQGIIGEMRKTGGSVQFGGTVGYCPQSAWIQNATIRENICFGRPFEEDKYWKAINDSCLGPDLEMLPNGDLTEVGEKGISLSGGQKQRLNICRAIYCDTDIQIFDDPLSALDAHVGKAVFQNVLQNSLSGKTRVLVTHALHFLPQVDYIYTVADGRIAERGTYSELMHGHGEFAKFVTEFGSKAEEEEGKKEGKEDAIAAADTEKDGKKAPTKTTPGTALMQVEERNTGAISWDVYKEYSRAGNGKVVLPLLFLSLVLIQGATVMSSYWFVIFAHQGWIYGTD